MKNAASWNVRGVERETQEIAEEAARRAGKSLGDWLDAIVAEQAAEQGVTAEDWNEDDKLDAIGERLSRLPRRDVRRPIARLPRKGADQESNFLVVGSAQAQKRLDEALARWEARATRAEARTAKALESVANWIEDREAERESERETIRKVAENLSSLEKKVVDSAMDEIDTLDIDARFEELASRAKGRRPLPRAQTEQRASGSGTAARAGRPEPRNEAAPPRTSATGGGWRHFGVDSPRVEPTRHDGPPTQREMNEGVEGLRARLDALREQRRQATSRSADDIHADLNSMSRSLSHIAPRNGAVALKGAVGDLGQRLDAARRAGADNRVLAPIDEKLREVIDTLRDHDPQAAVERLELELRNVANKVHELASVALNPETIAQIRAQSEDVSRLLAAAASRSVPVERLERQISELADRIERLAANPAPQLETERVMQSLADARAQIERSTPPAALVSIERQLEQLSRRVDEALSRPSGGLDMRSVEDLARRIESVRATVERQGQPRLDPAALETTLRDIAHRFDRATSVAADSAQPDLSRLETALSEISAKLDRGAPNGDSGALNATLQTLTSRLEDAFRAPGPSVATIDAAPLDDLARRIESVRLSIERQASDKPDLTRLESGLADIRSRLDRQTPVETPIALIDAIHVLADKVDRATAPPNDTGQLESLLQDMRVRLDAMPSQTTPTPPLENWLRRLDQKLETIGRNSTVDTKPIALAIQELGERMDIRSEPQLDSQMLDKAADMFARRLEARSASIDADALVGQISEIHGRLDSLTAAGSSNIALERTVTELIEELEATRKLIQSPSAPGAADIAELRAEQAQADRRMAQRLSSLQDVLEQLVSRFGRMGEGCEPTDSASNAINPLAPPPMPAQTKMRDEDMRAIPDRGAAARRAPTPENSGFLLEPGRGPAPRDSVDAPSAPNGKSDINAHIAAARRAAQVAMSERARREPQEEEGAAGGGGASIVGRVQQQAQSLLANHRKPLLLGAAVIAVATLAMWELRGFGGRPQPVQKSEAPATLSAPAPLASAKPSDGAAVDQAKARIDYNPVGALDTPKSDTGKSSTSPLPSSTPNPARASSIVAADLIATLPAVLPAKLHDAALGGDPAAETELGLRYFEGKLITRDPKLAARWFEAAANQNVPYAQYRLAAMYEKGVGIPRDAALARSWYLKAANAGNARAMHNLAVLYAEDGGNGKPDYAEASQWFRRGAEFGVRDSQFNLGVLYGRGLGVAQDLQQSWVYFSLAAQQGDADAGHKRDEVAAKLDATGLAGASKALADFKAKTPNPAVNDLPSASLWDSAPATPQAARQTPAVQGALPSPAGRV